jgi:D-3-phosphoglycerate dehydrogenase
VPLTPSTEKLFNDATFAKMKKGARIINVARGGVIDDDALVRALDSKQVAAAALDVFEEEPPAKDNPLVKRPDVICTPHLGASTVEAQEGVAVEIAEAVIGALNGELAATAVNAPMVPAEMLSALAPFIGLAEKLGRIALQLVDASSGLSEVVLTYKGSNKEDLDTRLLRANVIKGLVQRDTTASVNLVNADTLAKSRGIKFVEVIEPAAVSGGSELLTSMSVTVRGCRPVMQAAADANGAATVEGGVRAGVPWLNRVGSYNLSLAVEGKGLLLCA